MLLRGVDIETTGQAPPAEVIEFGRVDVRCVDSEWQVGRPMARLYRPLNGIPPETMAVHHITEMDMMPGTPVCAAYSDDCSTTIVCQRTWRTARRNI